MKSNFAALGFLIFAPLARVCFGAPLAQAPLAPAKVNDILFVHDPAVPEFSGPSESAVRPCATNWVTSTQQDTMSMIYNVPDTDGLRKEERSTQSIIPGRIRE